MSMTGKTLRLHLEDDSTSVAQGKVDLALPFVLPRLPDDAAFFVLCKRNKDWHMKRTAKGEIEVMAPSGAETGYLNGEVFFAVRLWNHNQGNPGYTFDSSAGFRLPSGAVRSPDVSWLRRDRWESLTQDERERFAPLCPDFVVELLSPTINLTYIQAKMLEYRDSGARLGRLIDRRNRHVYVHRPSQDVEELDNPSVVTGGVDLPSLEVPMGRIFVSGILPVAPAKAASYYEKCAGSFCETSDAFLGDGVCRHAE